MDGRRAIFTDDYLVRYVIHLLLQPGWWFVFSLPEKSSWLLSLRVALSLGVSRLSAVLVASDPVLLGKIWPLASFGPGVQRSRCTSSYVPIDVASKPYCFVRSFFVEVGFGLKLQSRRSFQCRVVAPFPGDEDDREDFARTSM